MFLFLLIAMVVVVAAVTLAVLGGDRAVLPETAAPRLVDPLPEARPVGQDDVERLRLPLAVRGYRMADVDDVLSRLGAELAERDDRISRLESALAGARAAGPGGAGSYSGPRQADPRGEQRLGGPYGEQGPGEDR